MACRTHSGLGMSGTRRLVDRDSPVLGWMTETPLAEGGAATSDRRRDRTPFRSPIDVAEPSILALMALGTHPFGYARHQAFPGFALLIRRILSGDKQRTTCQLTVFGPPRSFALSRVIGFLRPFKTASIEVHFRKPFLPFHEWVAFGNSILKPLPASRTKRRRFCGIPKSAT